MTEPEERAAWECTGYGLFKFVSDSRYRKMRHNIRKWYRPICAKCGPLQTAKFDAELTGAEAPSGALWARSGRALATWRRQESGLMTVLIDRSLDLAETRELFRAVWTVHEDEAKATPTITTPSNPSLVVVEP